MVTTAGQQMAQQANTSNNVAVFGSILINVKAYGAKGDGATNDSGPIQAAINYASSSKAGIVFFPAGKYLIQTGLHVPAGVSLIGFSGIADHVLADRMANLPKAVLFVTDLVNPAITIEGQGTTIEGLVFYYPNQVTQEALAPIVYPATIFHGVGGGPGTLIHYCSFINSYNGINLTNVTGGAGRSRIEHINMGAINRGIEIDYAFDTVRISDIQITPFFSLNFPESNLTKWSIANGYGIVLRRVDECFIDGVFVFGKFTGIRMAETGGAFDPKGAYGTITNTSFDNCDICISAVTTNVYGFDITNCHFAPVALTGINNRCVVLQTPSGLYYPRLRLVNCSFWGNIQAKSICNITTGALTMTSCWIKGDFFGNFFGVANSSLASLVLNGVEVSSGASSQIFDLGSSTGFLEVVNCRFNGNTTNLTPGTNIPPNAIIKNNDFKFGVVTPTLPLTTVVYTNNMGIPVRVFISGGTVTVIKVNTITTGLIAGMLELEPQDSISITYSSAPTWVWMGF